MQSIDRSNFQLILQYNTTKYFFHLKSRLRARSARWFFKRCYLALFFLFFKFLDCALQIFPQISIRFVVKIFEISFANLADICMTSVPTGTLEKSDRPSWFEPNRESNLCKIVHRSSNIFIRFLWKIFKIFYKIIWFFLQKSVENRTLRCIFD